MDDAAMRGLPALDGVRALSDATCAELRDVCAQAGYTEDTLEVISTVYSPSHHSSTALVRRMLLAVRDGSLAVADILGLLFACQADLEIAEVRTILGCALTDALLAAGFLAPGATGTSLRSNFQLLPLDHVWLIADHLINGPGSARADVVMPPGPTTGHLRAVTPAAPLGDVLDVGCGPGSLALVAAQRGARSVTGTDINPRAIHMAQFNARLNGLDSTRFLVGDLAEPVRGEHFDLVVAQPPFVIQPDASVPITFLHGGPTGETITLRVLAAVPDLLRPGGRALVLAEAPTDRSQALHQRFRAQLAGAPMDLVVLVAPTSSPLRQALVYAELEADDRSPDYAAAVARYLDHLDAQGISSFAQVLIVVRARGGLGADPRTHPFAATVPIKDPRMADGAALDVLLHALDTASLDNAALAETALRVSPAMRWARRSSAARQRARSSSETRRSGGTAVGLP